MTTAIQPVSLTKGQNVNLSKVAPAISSYAVGLGWSPRATPGQDFDLDAVAFLLTDSGKVKEAGDFVFFNDLVVAVDKNNVRTASAVGQGVNVADIIKAVEGAGNKIAVRHSGDNLTGEGEGDDETIFVNLNNLPSDVSKIVFGVSIYKAAERKQNFGQVDNAYIRIFDAANPNTVVARYDLTEDASGSVALIFAELYKNNNEWKFKAISQDTPGGLEQLCKTYGVVTA